jgi:hypothetical protein
MYSLLNGPMYANDQKQSIFKFRINSRPQKQVKEMEGGTLIAERQ